MGGGMTGRRWNLVVTRMRVGYSLLMLGIGSMGFRPRADRLMIGGRADLPWCELRASMHDLTIDRQRNNGDGTWEIAVALAIQFNIRRQRLDELRHDQMRHDDARHNRIGAWQVADEVQNKFGTPRHHDDSGADIPARHMVWDTGSNRWLLIRGVGTILGRWGTWH